MSSLPNINDNGIQPHVIDKAHAGQDSKQAYIMPPRREPLPLKPSESKSLSVTPIVAVIVSILVFLSGIVGGVIGSVSTNYHWKGSIETRVEHLEKQRIEDQQRFDKRFDYIQTQNEVNGKDLAGIKSLLEQSIGGQRRQRDFR